VNDIERAIQILRRGGLVAFPTETVYGLGADATHSAAVGRIFAVKGRPATNPLIVHVANAAVARRYAAHWPAAARKLAAAFWPGPLTLVLPKTRRIVAEATAGLSTVALRCPDHPMALELLRRFDGPVAAPSANRSTRISPTTAKHVRKELGEKVDLILDGGPCRVGIESTVLDLTQGRPVILRPGQVSRKSIEAIVGPVELFQGSADGQRAASSPGQQAVHYAPKTTAFRFEPAEARAIARRRRRGDGRRVFVANSAASIAILRKALRDDTIIEMPRTPAAYGRRFYAALHEADDANAAAIWIELPPDSPPWHAVRDRIVRATRGGGAGGRP
jgi:L-threonylcarbamoyladenylate synthase